MSDHELSMNCGCTPVYDTRYEGDGEPIVAVVEALATVEGVEPLEMEPLYDVIDGGAVDRLFEDHTAPTEAAKTLMFTVDGWNVFVRSDGSIRVCDPNVPDDSAPVFEKATGD